MGLLWTHQLRGFVTCANTKNRDCLWETGILVFCFSLTIAGSSRCRQESFKQRQERGTSCWNLLDYKLIGEKRCGALRHKTVWQQASLWSETVITRRTREEGFKALGVWITFDGHCTQELAEREVSAWRRFYALRQLLCDNNVALKYRLRLLTSCVVSSMYWCAGIWILSRTQCAHLRAVQDRMLRKMIYVPRLTHDKMGKAIAQLQGETQVPTWRRNVLCQRFFVVRSYCTYHDERSEEGNKQIVLA